MLHPSHSPVRPPTLLTAISIVEVSCSSTIVLINRGYATRRCTNPSLVRFLKENLEQKIIQEFKNLLYFTFDRKIWAKRVTAGNHGINVFQTNRSAHFLTLIIFEVLLVNVGKILGPETVAGPRPIRLIFILKMKTQNFATSKFFEIFVITSIKATI